MSEYKTHKITLYNDDELSFRYIIACLIEICGHTPIQAEQCALIAHNKGHIDVASGSFDKMYEILETLDHVNIEASIEQYESNLYR
jgi:ATP-dependent Clp protease adaptor protein ClpS|tara:strand:- start:59 stop:316 length:258 start_codon:yes stop_codon:yes gene_type:complete